MGTTRSYACTTQAGLTHLGANVTRPSRGVLPVRPRRATLASLYPGRGAFAGRHVLKRCPQKPVPIPRSQWCAWHARRKLYQPVGHFVGSVVSPILANIYLHELDQYMEQTKQAFDQGTRRKTGTAWRRVTSLLRDHRQRIKALKGDLHPEAGVHIARHEQKIRELGEKQRGLPASDPLDPHYRRLFYIRYADDCAPRRREGVPMT